MEVKIGLCQLHFLKEEMGEGKREGEGRREGRTTVSLLFVSLAKGKTGRTLVNFTCIKEKKSLPFLYHLLQYPNFDIPVSPLSFVFIPNQTHNYCSEFRRITRILLNKTEIRERGWQRIFKKRFYWSRNCQNRGTA